MLAINELVEEAVLRTSAATETLRAYVLVESASVSMSFVDPRGVEVGRLAVNRLTIAPVFREYMKILRSLSQGDLAEISPHYEALDIARYFKGHIYGAQDDYKKFSKKMVIDRILAENRIPGGSLVAFGDGYVEIENTKQVGGLAVAVASDEANNGSGRFDAWKHQRLLGVGADICIPDYRELDALMDVLFPN